MENFEDINTYILKMTGCHEIEIRCTAKDMQTLFYKMNKKGIEEIFFVNWKGLKENITPFIL